MGRKDLGIILNNYNNYGSSQEMTHSQYNEKH